MPSPARTLEGREDARPPLLGGELLQRVVRILDGHDRGERVRRVCLR